MICVFKPTRPTLLAMAVGAALVLGGCAVPEHMRIRTDVDPANEDDQVRFRTTYYFRVVDMCEDSPIYVNGLYRFRMTGKAGALGNTVHFESGTLHDYQIDPFGADVTYDDNLKRFKYASPEEAGFGASSEVCRKQLAVAETNIKQLLSICKQDKAGTGVVAGTPPSPLEELNACIAKTEAKTKKLLEDSLAKINLVCDQGTTVDKKAGEDDNAQEVCKNKDGVQPRRGFQVLGPEGWRTFKQSERLLMAMYSNGKPLIETMNKASSALLNARSRQNLPRQAEMQHQAQIKYAQKELDDYKGKIPKDNTAGANPVRASVMIEDVITALQGLPGQ